MELQTFNEPLPITKEFKETVQKLKKEMHKQYKTISKIDTPRMERDGSEIVKKRPDGYEYIEERYMRFALDEHFPGWSWQIDEQQFLGAEWVVLRGTLTIIDPYLASIGIIPPIRKFSGIESARIMYKRNMPHSPDNIVSIGNNCKAANSAALKVAINRLTHIGDDIYGKRVDDEGMGSVEMVLETNPTGGAARKVFMDFVTRHHIPYNEVFATLQVKNFTEITNFAEAQDKLQEHIDMKKGRKS